MSMSKDCKMPTSRRMVREMPGVWTPSEESRRLLGEDDMIFRVLTTLFFVSLSSLFACCTCAARWVPLLPCKLSRSLPPRDRAVNRLQAAVVVRAR